jgi:hypothetical protein
MKSGFKRRLVLSSLLSGSLAAYGYGRWVERLYPEVVHVDMPVPNLPTELAGLKVAHLTDLHMGKLNSPELMQKTVEMTNALNPDLIVLTGDFVLEAIQAAGPLAEILAQLKSRFGKYAVLGNHDVWLSARSVTRAFEHVGILMLINECVEIQHANQTLYLGGLDSVWAGTPDFTAITKHWQKGKPLLLMAHEPDYADILAKHHVPLVQLAGHTHGGQVRVPWCGSIVRVTWGKKYIMGRYDVGDVHLYVNRGIGCTSHPVRFACQPEITLMRLRCELS